jgi:hypothetical protein
MSHEDSTYIEEDENDDNRHLIRNTSACTFNSEISTGQFTITRMFDDRKKSTLMSEVVITQAQYNRTAHTSKPGKLFNEFGSQEIRKASSTTAKLGVSIVIISLVAMCALIVVSVICQSGDEEDTSYLKVPMNLEYNSLHKHLNGTLEDATTTSR